MFATLLAGFKILLHRLSGRVRYRRRDSSGRTVAPGLGSRSSATASIFSPCRTTFGGDPPVKTLLTRVRSTLLDAYEHQSYTYGSLVRKLALPRDPSRLPLVEVQFNLERLGTGLTFPGLEVEIDPNPKRFVNFDLFFNVVESDLGLAIDCDYNRDLFDRETVNRWLHHYQTLLDEMVADPGISPFSSLSLLDSVEHVAACWWIGTRPAPDYPKNKCIHQLF